MKPRHKTLPGHRRRARRARRRRRAGAQRLPEQPGVLLHAHRRSPPTRRRSDRAFRIGGLVEEGSVKREADGLTVQLRRHRHRQAHAGGLHRHPARPVQGRQGRGGAGQARRRRRVRRRARCWPSTTRTTCRPKPPKRWNKRAARPDAPAPGAPTAREQTMIPELGHFALILALVVALVQGVLPLVGAQQRQRRLDGAGAAGGAGAVRCSSLSPSAA